MTMACHTTKARSAGTTPTDIITYRYNKVLIYVPVAPTYTLALSHARDAFPQLKDLSDASLSLALAAPGHAQTFIGISAQAWPMFTTHMARYQIIDVQVTHPPRSVPIPDITITYADAEDVRTTEPAPPYHSESEIVDDEKAAYAQSCRPRTPSLPTSHPKRNWFLQKLQNQ